MRPVLIDWLVQVPGIAKLARHPIILAVAERILGPDILLWNSYLYVKNPGYPNPSPDPSPHHDCTTGDEQSFPPHQDG